MTEGQAPPDGAVGLSGFLRQRRYEIAVSVTISVLGFFAALSINSWRERSADREVTAALFRAVVEEARDNLHIYQWSFVPHADSGLVVREFALGTARGAMSNPIFVRNTPSGTIEVLALYLRNLELANGFARTTRELRVLGNDEGWEAGLVTAWNQNLTISKSSIDRVIGADPSGH